MVSAGKIYQEQLETKMSLQEPKEFGVLTALSIWVLIAIQFKAFKRML